VIEGLLTQLLSTLEDDLSDTRLLSCRVLRQLFLHHSGAVDQSSGDPGDHVSGLDQDRLHRIYPDLLRRLDDGCNDVRIAAAQTFAEYMKCFNHRNYNVVLYRAHIEAVYHGLLVHLDDQDAEIQLSVLGM